MSTKKFALLTALLSCGSAHSAYLFTNASAEGVSGPTQALVDAAYSGTSLDGQVTVTGNGIQQWVVANTGDYLVTAAGASGGSTTRATGGQGAVISTEISLVAGQVLNILVGQQGGVATFAGTYGGETGGGGGGSFVVTDSGTALLVAGGGGGAAEGPTNGGGWDVILNGVNASVYADTSGQDGTGFSASWSVTGVGGADGNGGTKPGWGGAGGGGFYTNGQGGASYAGEGGQAYLNGGLGGINRFWYGAFLTNIEGGFGGGAGAGVHHNYESNAGGGGGYSGGGGGNTRVGSGGGGGNYYTGTYIASDYNTGHGWVSFELASAAVPVPASILLLGLGLAGIGLRQKS